MRRLAVLLALAAVLPIAAKILYFAVTVDPRILYADEPYYVEASLHLLEKLGINATCRFEFARSIEPEVTQGYLNLEHPPLAKLLLSALYASGVCDARLGRLAAAASTVAALLLLAYTAANILVDVYGARLSAVLVYLVFWWLLAFRSTLELLGWVQMLEPYALLFATLALTLDYHGRRLAAAIATGLALSTKLTTVPVLLTLFAVWSSRLGLRRSIALSSISVMVFIAVHAVFSLLTGYSIGYLLLYQLLYHTLKAYAPGVRGSPLDALFPTSFVMCAGDSIPACAKPNPAVLVANLMAAAYAFALRCECARRATAFALLYPVYIAFAIAIYAAGASVYTFYLGVYEPFAAFTASICSQAILLGGAGCQGSTGARTAA